MSAETKKYIKKQIGTEAIQYNGSNAESVLNFIRENRQVANIYHGKISIHTLEGVSVARIGDYVLKGAMGEIYPCQKHVFEMTYDMVADGV